MAELIFSEQDTNSLVRFGDYLDSIDEVREKNEAGFNLIDKGRWHRIRGDAFAMTKALYKYRRQLSGAFQEAEETLSRARVVLEKMLQGKPVVSLIEVNSRWGTQLDVQVQGQLIDFNVWRQTMQECGCWWDSARRMNYMPAKAFSPENFQKLFERLTQLGYNVVHKPLEIKQGKIEITTVKDAIQAIQDGVRGIMVIRQKPNGKWEILSGYDPKLAEILSNKTGIMTRIAEFNPETKARETFQIEYVMELVEKMRELLPSFQVFSDDLPRAIKEHQDKIERMKQQIPAVRALLAPEFAMFPHQNEGHEFLKKTNGNALIGFDMGLGKTLCTASYLATEGKRAIVVGPKNTRRTWIVELKKFFPTVYTDLNCLELTPKTKFQDLSQMRLVSINYESLGRWMDLILAAKFDVLVVDESHRIKSDKTLAFQNVHQVALSTQHHILLSGTAIKNKKDELYTQVEIIRPGFFSDRNQIKQMTIGGLWNTLQSFYINKTKQQALKDMPEKLSSKIEIEVDDCPDFEPSNGLQIEEIARLKAEVAVAKAEATAGFVSDLLRDSDASILVFSDSVEAVKIIAEKLGDDAVIHHGTMNDEARERVKMDWQNGKLEQRVFVTTRQSLATGANMQRASIVVFNDLPYTAADVDQAESRAHRIGTRSTVNVYWLIAQDNNWDQKVSDLIWRKYQLAKMVTQGKQLTPAEREFAEKEISIADLRRVLLEGRK